jgi:flavorubredoxin
MTPHAHHWGSMMIFEDTTKSLFPSDLFLQPGANKPVLSEDLSEAMTYTYKEFGFFGSEEPVRQTTKRLMKLSPNMVFTQHGSCIDKYVFSKYTDAIMNNNFAYSGMLLGQELGTFS